MKTTMAVVVLIVFAFSRWTVQAGDLERVYSPPPVGNFYSLAHTNWPPLPCLPADFDVYLGGTNELGDLWYLFDDTAELTLESESNNWTQSEQDMEEDEP